MTTVSTVRSEFDQDGPTPETGLGMTALPIGTSPPPPVQWPDPYRILFPIGAVFALWGALVWPLTWVARLAYPGVTHRGLMMQGFELSFVLGFLLTAIPGFTGGQKFRPFELIVAAALMIAFGCSVAVGVPAAASLFAAFAIAWAAAAIVTRVIVKRLLPPEEFAFVGLGLVLGFAGTLWQALAGFGVAPVAEPAPFFAQRLVSLGMMLSLVLGIGGLLVPAFAGIPNPLAIPGLAKAHERRGRRGLYLILALVLGSAFVLEAKGLAREAAVARAVVATVMLLWVWKLPAPSTRNDTFSVALRLAGGCVLVGLWLSALQPAHALAGFHVMFIGGFGLLTIGIATRVVVSHGRHVAAYEKSLLRGWQVVALLLAATARAAAESFPAAGAPLLGVSGLLWSVAWSMWLWGAIPLIVRVRPATQLISISKASA